MKAHSIESACDACAGAGDDENCMCGGSGLATDAVVYLRDQLLKRPKRAVVEHTVPDCGYDYWYLAINGTILLAEGDVCQSDYRFTHTGPDKRNTAGERLWTKERLELAAKLINGG